MFDTYDTAVGATVDIQRERPYYGWLKALNTLGYFSVIYLSWLFFTDRLSWHIPVGCVILNAGWLLITRIKISHLLQTFFDVLSRIETIVPIVCGLLVSVVVLISPALPIVHYIAIAQMLGWVGIYLRYRANRIYFERKGHGLVPRGTWINPPAEVMRPGDLILTSGNVAKLLHETVGHAETVLKMPDGSMKLFSSYMDRGAFLHDLDVVTILHEHGDYILLHLNRPWTDEQSFKAAAIAEEMIADNQAWAANENRKYNALIDKLPLSLARKDTLRKWFHVTGYDWFGTFLGRRAPNRWTCIAAGLELYHRMGVETGMYGTGLLGFGTTIFDPIMPVRFLSDPAFRLVMEKDRTA